MFLKLKLIELGKPLDLQSIATAVNFLVPGNGEL